MKKETQKQKITRLERLVIALEFLLAAMFFIGLAVGIFFL